jgi:hypothetical protein
MDGRSAYDEVRIVDTQATHRLLFLSPKEALLLSLVRSHSAAYLSRMRVVLLLGAAMVVPASLAFSPSGRPTVPTVGLPSPTWTTTTTTIRARRRRGREDDYDDDDYDDEDDDFEYRRRRGRRDDLGGFQERRGLDLPSGFGRRDGWRLPESVSKSLLAGVFVLGVGLGVTVDSQVNTNPKDLASRDAIDNAAPNPTLCAKLGASAMAFDERVFVTFNPFNIYVSQADVKPACVLLEANVVPTLRDQGLITDKEGAF